MLLKPHDPLAHAAYADSLLAQYREDAVREAASIQLLQTALREYLRSIELYDDFLRGFCGVKVCCTALLSMNPETRDNKTAAKQVDALKNSTAPPISRRKLQALDNMSSKCLLKSSLRDDKTRGHDNFEAILKTLTTSSEVAV